MRDNDELNTLLDDPDFPGLELPGEAAETEDDDLQLSDDLLAQLDGLDDLDDPDDWESFEPLTLPGQAAETILDADPTPEPESEPASEPEPTPEPEPDHLHTLLRQAREKGTGAKEKFRSWRESVMEQKTSVSVSSDPDQEPERPGSLAERLRQMQEDICDNIEEQQQETLDRPKEQDVLREKFDQFKRDVVVEAGISLQPKEEPETTDENTPHPRASELTQEDIDAFFAAALEKQRLENLKEAREVVDQSGVPLDGSRVDEEPEAPDLPEALPEEKAEEPSEDVPLEEEEVYIPLEGLLTEEEESTPEPEAPQPTPAPRRASGSRVTPKHRASKPQGKGKTSGKAYAAERKRVLKLARRVQYYGFFGTMLVFFLIGLAFFARPKTSALENRELTTFPQFTISGFLNGDFTGEISTWYADTYPLREGLIAGANRLQNLYGLRGTQLIGNGNTSGGEEIPDSYDSSAQEVEETATATEAPVEETENLDDLEDGTIYDDLAQVGDIYIAGNKGFGVYYFVQSNSDRFVELMNKQYEQIKDEANLYVLVAPISAGVMLDQSVLDTIGASDESAAIDYLYSGMEDGIQTVSVFDTLKAHNAEYIYFNTDHHWTSLGAYYAYKEFCKVKGWTAHSLDDFETMEFTGFLGTFYTKSNASATLAANADTVTAYIPMGTNDMTMVTQAGQEYSWKIITDVSTWNNSTYYSCFVGGDEQFAEIHNPDITDGSSIVVVKDSYADAFIPFLVDHYQDVYICDFRYYPNTIQSLVEEKGIDDVLYLLAIGNTSATSGVTNIAARVGD